LTLRYSLAQEEEGKKGAFNKREGAEGTTSKESKLTLHAAQLQSDLGSFRQKAIMDGGSRAYSLKEPKSMAVKRALARIW
jgi:hypothetical protein